jgi:hypothetical protein
MSERDRVSVANRLLRDSGDIREVERRLTTDIRAGSPAQLPIRDDDVGEEPCALGVSALGYVVAGTDGQHLFSEVEVASDRRITSLVPVSHFRRGSVAHSQLRRALFADREGEKRDDGSLCRPVADALTAYASRLGARPA